MFATLLVALSTIAADKPANQAAEKPATAAAFAFHDIETRLISATNAERKRHGLEPLEVDVKLMKSARKHASWMTNRQSLRHTHAAVAENIAMGQPTSREVVRDWMNSPGHRANILNRRHRRIGVAAFITPRGTIYWCQQFLH